MTTSNLSAAPNAAVGIADHSGWAVCVTVVVNAGVPVVVDRRRLELIEPGVPSQPYHHETLSMPLPEAERLVLRVRDSVMRTTFARLSALREELQPYTIVAMTLRNPPMTYAPITVAEAHVSYPVMCRADAMMYHDAIVTTVQRLGIRLVLHDRGQEAVRAAARLGVSLEDVERFLQTAGESLGPPWQKEHRFAAAAALCALADRVQISQLV